MFRDSRIQAVPPETIPITPDQFSYKNETAVYWLGSAGIFINSYGTTILVDPAIDMTQGENGELYSEVSNMRLLKAPPIVPNQVPHVDAILYTHADEDHMGNSSALKLLNSGAVYHSTNFVGRKLVEIGVPQNRICTHPAYDTFQIGSISVKMTAASHEWQLSKPEIYDWHYTLEDCTGFQLTTPDGVIWDPGDSVLLDEHLNQPCADLLFIDFSDDEYHFGTKNSVRLANKQENAQIIAFHWGTFDCTLGCYNANPLEFIPLLKHADRLHILAQGEKYVLKSTKNHQ